MSIPVPNLDDRGFADLVDSARNRIQQVDPNWTDLSVHDPGIVLVEAFAHLTDILLYRLNRVPERLYAVYLNLLGTALRPPSAAATVLQFTRVAADGPEIRIPRGTRVGTPPGVPGAPQPVFSTLDDAVITAGASSVRVEASDVQLVDAILIGTGTGLPGQVVQLPGAPVIAGPGLVIGIEVAPSSLQSSGEAVSVDDRTFRVCQEVEVFADASPDTPAVRIDRTSGTVVFAFLAEANAPHPAVPEPGTQIRAWYRTGGGERGNVAAGGLNVMRDPIPSVRVTNPEPATGGRDVESLEDALRRAPQDFQARDRAVTARDYEVLALRHAGVGRARAATRRDLWAFAKAGEVEIVLVPFLPESMRGEGAVRVEDVTAHARDEVLSEVEHYLAERATIGADPVVRWGRYKQLLVHATLVVRADENPDAVRDRVTGRLSAAINPLPAGPTGFGSGFGRALRVSNLYRALEQAEPGVLYVDRVTIEIDRVPDVDATSLVRADGQPGAWFVGQRDTLFRTTNSGDGWEACAVFDGETVRAISPYPAPGPGRPAFTASPGLVAVATSIGDGARVHVSRDLGETWFRVAELGFTLADLTWVDRAGTPVLLVAGESGLYEVTLGAGAVPVQNLVDESKPDRGFYAVDTLIDARGQTGVVVAAEESAGVWLSRAAGAPESFARIRNAGEDIRCLSVQYDGPAVWVWVGRTVLEGAGTGCSRIRLDDLARTDPATLPGQWEDLGQGWTGGTCWAVEVIGDAAYAATQSGGVVRLQLGAAAPSWDQRDVNCGLPLRDRARFEPVRGVSGAVGPDGATLVLAAGPRGVLRSRDEAQSWTTCSARIVDDVVTLPLTWLFCSGEHRIEVVRAGG